MLHGLQLLATGPSHARMPQEDARPASRASHHPGRRPRRRGFLARLERCTNRMDNAPGFQGQSGWTQLLGVTAGWLQRVFGSWRWKMTRLEQDVNSGHHALESFEEFFNLRIQRDDL